MTLHVSSPQVECRGTILLVEDEPFVRDATCRILQNAGFDVIPTADAQEAMAAYEQFRQAIDLLLTDVILPGRSGLQLAQELRTRSSAISILLTSGYGESATASNPADSYAHYLAKPYSRQSLLEKIGQILSHHCCECAASEAG